MASSPLRSLFRRGDTSTPDTDAPAVAEPELAPAEPVGKGRPTPKRREAERRRRVVQAPKSRKEAARLQREQTRERRAKGRQGLARGDDRYLPPRDAGPARGFVRDYVDSRRNLTSYFIPATLVVFLFGTSPVPAMRYAANALLLFIILTVIFDSVRLGRSVVTDVRQRFPNEPTKGLKTYAITRSMQFRRLRVPKPRVKLGDPV
jgi:Protein of unknown function (DUF3043)